MVPPAVIAPPVAPRRDGWMRSRGRRLSGHLRSLARTVWAATALLLALGVVCGVLAGAAGLTISDGLALIVTLLGLAVAIVLRRRRALWLPVLLLAAVVIGAWRYTVTRPPAGAAGLPFYIGQDVTLVGSVMAEPEPLDRGENVRVSVETLTASGSGAPRRVAGAVLAHLATVSDLAYGDRLSLAGGLAAPPDLAGGSPGAYKAYLASQGIYAVLDYPRLKRLGSGAASPLLALAIAIRRFLEGGIRHSLPQPAAALLLGILLGTRTRALGALTAPFIATGMIHVVAISGLKVTIVAGTADRLARRLLGPRYALAPALAVLLLYVLVTGATPAGLRAGVMWTLALLAIRFGRRSDALTSLALAAAILCAVSPRILWDLGFGLSLAGTASIVLLEPRIERRLRRVPAVAREGLSVTLAAQVGTLPLLISGFGQISTVSPLANALLLPLLGPIMALGLPVAALGALLPGLGSALGLLVYPFLAAMIAAVGWLARLPLAALPAAPWPLGLVAAYYGLVAVIASRPLRTNADEDKDEETKRDKKEKARGTRSALRRALYPVAGAGVLLLATVAWRLPPRVSTVAVLSLHGGQGLLLSTPSGGAVLVDAGDAPSLLDAALGNRLPFWRSHLDAVILTDSDRAHVAGLRDVLDRYSLGGALDPGAVYPSTDYAAWRAALRQNGVPEAKLRAGRRVNLGDGLGLDALLPAGLDPSVPRPPCAVRLTLGRLSILLPNRAALDIDPVVLAAGAHGATVLLLPAGPSGPTIYDRLVRAIRPRLVLLPSPDDAHDDPASDAVAVRAARAIGARAWQSDGADGLDLTADASLLGFHAQTASP